jgi:hypothetical protein
MESSPLMLKFARFSMHRLTRLLSVASLCAAPILQPERSRLARLVSVARQAAVLDAIA